jgi:hypothetical protein
MTITMVTIDAHHDRIPRAHPRIGCTNHVILAGNSHDRASTSRERTTKEKNQQETKAQNTQ